MAISVLLVDDHAMVREGLRLVLSGHPEIRVVGEACNGREAVRAAHELRPDVVIMDVAMPELNGIDATRLMREQGLECRIIVLSMYTQAEYVFRATQAGANGYLVKESASTELVEAIRTVHRGRRYLSPAVSDVVMDDYLRRGQRTADEDPLERLSGREREVLQLTVEGRSTQDIAEAVALSPKTVETYRSRMLRKLGISSLPELVKFAIRHGLTTVDQ